MSTASDAAMVLGCMAVCCLMLIGCVSTKSVGEPPAEAVSPPVSDQASIQAMGPPPGYVKPENYWVREKIILTSEPEPPKPTTPKRAAKKTKKSQKTN
jgi:hypothetical protein